MENSPPVIPQKGVSAGLKWFVIGLTVVTVIAFLVVAGTLFTKAFDGKTKSSKESVELQIAKKLQAEGLPAKAIEQYEKFLSQPRPHKQQTDISLTLAELYIEQNRCDDALPWLYRIELTAPKIFEEKNLNDKVRKCLKRLKEK